MSLDNSGSSMGLSRNLMDGLKLAIEAEAVKLNASQIKPFFNATGSVTASISSIFNGDIESTFPDVLPSRSIPWPEPIMNFWESAKFSSHAGIFPMISRVWIAIDHRLIIWDYETGNDFVCFNELTEIILCVSPPVEPLPDIFQPHISFLIAVTTVKSVHLLGISFDETNKGVKTLRLINLNYAVAVPCLLLQLVCSNATKRIFASGIDGNLYEVLYSKEDFSYRPRIRIFNHSSLFPLPVPRILNDLWNRVRYTWSLPKEGLLDIAIDDRRRFIYTLDCNSVIQVWKMVENRKLRFISSLKHRDAVTQFRGGTLTRPLLRLFPVYPVDGSHEFIAVSENGTQYRYNLNEAKWGRISTSLTIKSILPSFLNVNQELLSVFLTDHSLFTCFNDRQDASASDTFTVISTPPGIYSPHQNIKSMISKFNWQCGSQPFRIEAIEEVLSSTCSSSVTNATIQTLQPPRRILIVHRYGILFLMQLRPIDILHLILAFSQPSQRATLIQRFKSLHSLSDFTSMLVQLSCDSSNASFFGFQLPISPVVPHSSLATVTILDDTSPESSHRHNLSWMPKFSLEQICSTLLSPISLSVRQLLLDILREYLLPSFKEVLTPSGEQRIHVQMSILSTGVVRYFSHLLFPLWREGVKGLDYSLLIRTETALLELLRFFNQFLPEVLSEDPEYRHLDISWTEDKAVITFPPSNARSSSRLNRFTSAQDFCWLQSLFLSGVHTLIERALQVIKLIHRTHDIPIDDDEGRLTFGEVLFFRDAARRVSASVCQNITQNTQLCHIRPKLEVIFSELQKECPYMFCETDIAEYEFSKELEQITTSKIDKLLILSKDHLHNFERRILPFCSTFWTSGKLSIICSQFTQLQCHDIAVRLFLAAARQIDPSDVGITIHRGKGTSHSLTGSNRNYVDSDDHFINESSEGVYREKIRILTKVTEILNEGWETNRVVIEHLIGTHTNSGSIWDIEASDELAHIILFDWFRSYGDDPVISGIFYDALLMASSVFLEPYLEHNMNEVGALYGRYLSRIRKNPTQAIRALVQIAQSPLLEVPQGNRIKRRLECWNEALFCAESIHSDLIPQLSFWYSLTEIQQHLGESIRRFLNSTDSSLVREMIFHDKLKTEEEVAREHLDFVESNLLTHDQIMLIGGMFSYYGGAEVQMHLLRCSCVTDPVAYASCIEDALNQHNMPIEETARRILKEFRGVIGFPFAHIAKILEAHCFKSNSSEDSSTIRVFISAGIEPVIVFNTILSILEYKELGSIPCHIFDSSGITRAFLVNTLSYALLNFVESVSYFHDATVLNQKKHFLELTKEWLNSTKLNSAANSSCDSVITKGFANLDKISKVLLLQN